MSKNFTLLLFGPAGSGKSAFVAGLSKIDIFKHITASKQGGANTTKIATTYEFSSNCEALRVTDCIASENEQQEKLLEELQNASNSEDGVVELFNKINDKDFSKKCSSITIQLPCKKNLIPDNSLFDTIVVRDSRGFGDVDDNLEINIDDLGITYDVNAILFLSISAIQQPAIFSKIIENVIKFNLKTPMFLLRRDIDLTQNDVDFENSIINNISDTDQQLSQVILSMGELDKKNRVNNLVFNLPEVKAWKGALNVSSEQNKVEIDSYSVAVEEILHYSIAMYDKLYNVLLEKMQGEYQNLFVENVLNKLLSEESFEIAANIANYPRVKPGRNYYEYRDTAALAFPVELYNNKVVGEYPFSNEKSARGNRYADGVIPSYSYSCVNFRNIFRSIVCKLVSDYRLIPIFSTFLDIVLKESTISSYTGYTFEDCRQDAFKFDTFVSARKKCTILLSNSGLVEDDAKWKPFSYSPSANKYEGSEAIAVLIYKNLTLNEKVSSAFNSLTEVTFAEAVVS